MVHFFQLWIISSTSCTLALIIKDDVWLYGVQIAGIVSTCTLLVIKAEPLACLIYRMTYNIILINKIIIIINDRSNLPLLRPHE